MPWVLLTSVTRSAARRPEPEIAVVSHWVFLSHLLRPHGFDDAFVQMGNAEMRFVTLQERAAKPRSRSSSDSSSGPKQEL